MYLGWLNGWPPLEPCLNDLPCETVQTFRHCLAVGQELEQSEGGDNHLLNIGSLMVEELLLACSPQESDGFLF